MEASRVPAAEINVGERLLAYQVAMDGAFAEHYDQQQSEITELARVSHPSVVCAREAFLDLLLREGSHRARGMLVMAGYEMFGGTDLTVAARAAVAIEMVQAGALILDDIQDKSPERRGGPSVHVMLAHKSAEYGWSDDSIHHGTTLATNAATQGLQRARTVLEELDAVSSQQRLIASTMLGTAIEKTCDGQNSDSSLRASELPSEDQIFSVMAAKTAYYTILNPLQVGMVLAGASSREAGAINDFALHTGIAYQIRNDMQIITDDARDDIAGNKPTLLTHHALVHAKPADIGFLQAMLSTPETIDDAQFARCQQILVRSGAVAQAHAEIQKRVAKAQESLPVDWPNERTKFLTSIIDYIANS